MTEKLGVLVMAYGTPASLDEVEAYYTDIRRGTPPPPELLEELVARYRAIGGHSPLLEITRAQARGIEQRLDGVAAFLGQKHAAPLISDAVGEMAARRIDRAAGLVLAPHYSALSVGDYAQRAQRAAEETGWSGKLEMIDSWHLEVGYVELLAQRIRAAFNEIAPSARARTTVVFTAHSLPTSIVASGDPYADQLAETADAVARRAEVDRWRVGWQSAGRTDAPWLGPDILEIVERLASEGELGVVICPCGFVSDHLEVLYDLDVEARSMAQKLGIEFTRTAAPNDDRAFLDMLAGVVRRTLGS